MDVGWMELSVGEKGDCGAQGERERDFDSPIFYPMLTMNFVGVREL